MFLSDLTQRSGLMHGENVSFVPIRYPRRVIAPEVDLSITTRICGFTGCITIGCKQPQNT